MKFFLILFILGGMNLNVFSQSKEQEKQLSEIAGKWKLDDDKNLSYSNVIDSLNFNKEELLNRVTDYFLKNRIEIIDKNSDIITGKGIFKSYGTYFFISTFYNFDANYIFQASIENGKVRTLMTVSELEVNSDGEKPSHTVHRISETYPVNQEAKMMKKMQAAAFIKLHFRCQETIDSFSKTLKTASQNNSTATRTGGTSNSNPSTNENGNSLSGIPNYYALFIGVDSYQFSSAKLLNLKKPVKDATSFKDIMISKYSVPASNSILLKNPTRAEILRALEDLSKKVTEKDNLLIFYAGHGYWDERLKVGYWLPSDSKADDKGSWIANSTIRDYIAGIQSKHTLLISDACFSGSIFKTREVSSAINEYGVSKIYQLSSRKAMTSGTLTTVPDESKFMQYLVKRLVENTDKYLTTRQLFFSLETAVLNNTTTVPQLGVIQETGDEGGDFIFIKKN